MKGGAVLETLGKVTESRLDKTGTPDRRQPVVTDIVSVDTARPKCWKARLPSKSAPAIRWRWQSSARRNRVSAARGGKMHGAIGGEGVTGNT